MLQFGHVCPLYVAVTVCATAITLSFGCSSLHPEVASIDISDLHNASTATLEDVLSEETSRFTRLIERLPTVPIEQDEAAARVKRQTLLLDIMKARLLSEFLEQRLIDQVGTHQGVEASSEGFTLDRLLEETEVADPDGQ
jgi:hypothetical protein